ncbi:hypothetical protein PR202_ga12492 [Eleusine coracana subsp. coracana]|uniref:Uncharacterized protein n=1 Tax=Eleusine coracana subsp. coracana TaxID=191504 RepID=A0AAV5CC22_ELECO|nr:hypothetical protein PR202_ga12492 [Eleusine coracana subsp. coracana]
MGPSRERRCRRICRGVVAGEAAPADPLHGGDLIVEEERGGEGRREEAKVGVGPALRHGARRQASSSDVVGLISRVRSRSGGTMASSSTLPTVTGTPSEPNL